MPTTHPQPTPQTLEANFDGLVGATHHFLNTAPGNLASQTHRGEPANPRAAARQGLDKMRRLADLGIPQAVLPPQPRPNLDLLAALGFAGPAEKALAHAKRDAPHLLAAASSSSFMWAANAATVSPSPDTADSRLHLTPANLITALHRAQEPRFTAAALRSIFADESHFAVHDPLPAAPDLADEGAANHTRLAPAFDAPAIHLFAFGRDPRTPDAPSPTRFPARQSALASEAIARQHGLNPAHVVFARQHPAAIDAGVFHHDVIGVGHLNRLLLHQQAFADPAATHAQLDRAAASLNLTLRHTTLTDDQLPIDQAVATYLFNSQIVSTPDGRTILIAPAECETHAAVRAAIDHAINLPQDQRPFDAAEFVDVRQSMRNGGGPACLRLRVVMTPAQRAAANAAWLTPALHDQLIAWVDHHYPDATTLDTLADPAQLRANLNALDALAPILHLTDSPWHQQITDCANRWLG